MNAPWRSGSESDENIGSGDSDQDISNFPNFETPELEVNLNQTIEEIRGNLANELAGYLQDFVLETGEHYHYADASFAIESAIRIWWNTNHPNINPPQELQEDNPTTSPLLGLIRPGPSKAALIGFSLAFAGGPSSYRLN